MPTGLAALSKLPVPGPEWESRLVGEGGGMELDSTVISSPISRFGLRFEAPEPECFCSFWKKLEA